MTLEREKIVYVTKEPTEVHVLVEHNDHGFKVIKAYVDVAEAEELRKLLTSAQGPKIYQVFTAALKGTNEKTNK